MGDESRTPGRVESVDFDDDNIQVAALQPRICDFWKNNAEAWLITAESQFAIAGIRSDRTKYNHILVKLPDDFQGQILDLTRQGYQEGSYEELKIRILNKYKRTQSEIIEQVLDKEELGDRKPSEFLRHLTNLAGEVGLPEKFVLDRWKRKLPQNITSLLLTLKSDIKPDDLGAIADQIYLWQPPQVAAVSNNNGNYRRNNNNHYGRGSFRPRRGRSNSRNRNASPHPNRNRSSSPSRYRPEGSWCWYHYKFGDEARKCQQPCRFKPKNSQPDQ